MTSAFALVPSGHTTSFVFSPPVRADRRRYAAPFEPGLTPNEHVASAALLPHPLLEPRLIDPGIEVCFAAYRSMGSDIVRWRLQQLAYWRGRAEALEPARIQWLATCDPRVSSVLHAFHAPLCLEMLRSIGHPLVPLLQDAFTHGFSLFGWVPSVGLLGPPSQRKEPADLSRLVGPAGPQVEYWLQSRRPEPRFDEHSAINARMVATGRYEVVSIEDLGDEPVLVSPSFTIMEDRGSGKKPRPCDDLTASGGNACSASKEVLVQPGIDDWLDDAARVQREFPGCDPALAVEDEDGAYTNWPARESHALVLLLIGPRGHYELHRSRCLNFGGHGCVYAYAHARLGLTDIIRWCFAVPARAYVDDTGIVEPSFASPSGTFCFRALHRLLGVPLKQPPKRREPAASNPLLGTVLHVAVRPPMVKPDPAKMERARDACTAALEADRLMPAGAARLAGRLGFLASQLYARVGRLALMPLYEWQRFGGNGWLDSRRRAALRVAREVLGWAQCRAWNMGASSCSPRWLVYSDAAGENPRHGCGLLLFEVRSGRARLVEQFHFSFPDDILVLFATRANYIGVLELCMALVALFLWGRALAKSAYIHFVDNDGAGFALAKGLSGEPDFDALVSGFWALAAALACTPWIARVASSSNPADAASHGAGDTPPLTRMSPLWAFLRQLLCDHGVPTRDAVAAAQLSMFAPGRPPTGVPQLSPSALPGDERYN